MNSKNIVAISEEKQDLCMVCLKEKATHKYEISGRRYGSFFDEDNTYWQCCDKCHKFEYYIWANELPSADDYCEEYKLEDEILEFIHNLPLQSQELFFNTFNSSNQYPMDAQDWIDYELGELPHRKCKEYYLYSHDEIKAYHDRFPNCTKVYKKVWKDGSVSCMCHKHAHGNADGTCDINISDECYMCDSYKPKSNEFTMKTVDEIEEYYKNEKKRLEDMLEYAQARLVELEDNKKEYLEKYRYE